MNFTCFYILMWLLQNLKCHMWLKLVALIIFLLNSIIVLEPHFHAFCSNKHQKSFCAPKTGLLEVRERYSPGVKIF